MPAGGGRPGGHPPVVLLVLDELPLVSLLGPDGRIDADPLPALRRAGRRLDLVPQRHRRQRLDALRAAGDAHRPLPGRAAAPHYSQYPDNLFTAFGGLYDIRAQESITRLCPPSRCDQPVSPEQGLDVLVRRVPTCSAGSSPRWTAGSTRRTSYREPTAAEVGLDAAEPPPDDPKFRWDTLDDNQPARFTDFLAGLRPTERPTLHFLHLLMPHWPWAYLPSGARYDAPTTCRTRVPAGSTWPAAAPRAARLHRPADRRDAAHPAGHRPHDQALLVVTADHGVSFTEGAQGRGMDAIRRSPGEVAWVPMFVKEPGQRTGRVDDRNWEHVDLLPTVADLARIRLPGRTDGRSARQGPRDGPTSASTTGPGKPSRCPAVCRSRPRSPAAPAGRYDGR